MANKGSWLSAGAYLSVNDYLVSDNSLYFAIMQPDGNFVLYYGSGPSSQGPAYWASNTSGQGQCFAIMQSDGNFVIYKGSDPAHQGAFVWNSGTVKGQCFAVLQDDANFVIYQGSDPTQQGAFCWNTGTVTMTTDISVISVTLVSSPASAALLQQIANANAATFQAQSFSWGADNAPTIASGSVGAGAAGKAKFAEASLTKVADHVASPVLFQLLVSGAALGTVMIEFRKAGAPGPGSSTPEVLATITLSTVSVTHFGQSVSGSYESLQEVVTLAYDAAHMTINAVDPTGKITTGTPIGWNQVTNAPI